MIRSCPSKFYTPNFSNIHKTWMMENSQFSFVNHLSCPPSLVLFIHLGSCALESRCVKGRVCTVTKKCRSLTNLFLDRISPQTSTRERTAAVPTHEFHSLPTTYASQVQALCILNPSSHFKLVPIQFFPINHNRGDLTL